MAFMMPVMKNEFDIYNGSRTRKASECSSAASVGGGQRSRKVSECKSECQSFSTSPGNGFEYMSPHHRMQMNRSASSRCAFPRNSSRTSQSSNAFAISPTRAYSSQASSPPKPTAAGSQGSLNKFHIRLVDKLRKSFRKESAKRS